MGCDNCIDNLPNCDAQCCKQLTFHFPTMTEDEKYFYKTRGCEVRRLPNRTWMVTVATTCPKLKENNCTLHNTPEKPSICTKYGYTKLKTPYPKGCIY